MGTLWCGMPHRGSTESASVRHAMHMAWTEMSTHVEAYWHDIRES